MCADGGGRKITNYQLIDSTGTWNLGRRQSMVLVPFFFALSLMKETAGLITFNCRTKLIRERPITCRGDLIKDGCNEWGPHVHVPGWKCGWPAERNESVGYRWSWRFWMMFLIINLWIRSFFAAFPKKKLRKITFNLLLSSIPHNFHFESFVLS